MDFGIGSGRGNSARGELLVLVGGQECTIIGRSQEGNLPIQGLATRIGMDPDQPQGPGEQEQGTVEAIRRIVVLHTAGGAERRTNLDPTRTAIGRRRVGIAQRAQVLWRSLVDGRSVLYLTQSEYIGCGRSEWGGKVDID